MEQLNVNPNKRTQTLSFSTGEVVDKFSLKFMNIRILTYIGVQVPGPGS